MPACTDKCLISSRSRYANKPRGLTHLRVALFSTSRRHPHRLNSRMCRHNSRHKLCHRSRPTRSRHNRSCRSSPSNLRRCQCTLKCHRRCRRPSIPCTESKCHCHSARSCAYLFLRRCICAFLVWVDPISADSAGYYRCPFGYHARWSVCKSRLETSRGFVNLLATPVSHNFFKLSCAKLRDLCHSHVCDGCSVAIKPNNTHSVLHCICRSPTFCNAAL